MKRKKVNPIVSAAMSKLGRASWKAREKKLIEQGLLKINEPQSNLK